jgi:putative ABC transport system substrate-binding protein
MKRRELLAGIVSTAVCPGRALGQHAPGKTYVILWVSTEAQPDPFIAGFREGMRERGYIEG